MKIIALPVPLALFSILISGEPLAANNDNLRQQAAEFASKPVYMDPRISVPDCPQAFEFEWKNPQNAALSVKCPQTGWRIILPLAANVAASGISRGQTLHIEARGMGFKVSVAGVVERPAQGNGQILVRNNRSGKRFIASEIANGDIIFGDNSEMH